jgi:heat shock 70kDa protein 1/2/6/8
MLILPTLAFSDDRLKTPVNNALRDAKLSVGNLDEVILVGGST